MLKPVGKTEYFSDIKEDYLYIDGKRILIQGTYDKGAFVLYDSGSGYILKVFNRTTFIVYNMVYDYRPNVISDIMMQVIEEFNEFKITYKVQKI